MSNEHVKIYALAALVTKNSQLLEVLLTYSPDVWKSSIKACTEFVKGRALQAEVDDKPLLLLLTEVFKLNYFELYDEMIRFFPNPFYINQMGHYFFEQLQIDFALDYYSISLNRNKLDSTGYFHLSRLYLQQPDTMEEGLNWLEQSIQLDPSRFQAYMVYCTHCKDPYKRNRMKDRFMERFPQYKEIPYIKQI